MTGLVDTGCCARATTGQAAIPPAKAMNARRLIPSPNAPRDCIVTPYVKAQEEPRKGDVAGRARPQDLSASYNCGKHPANRSSATLGNIVKTARRSANSCK